MKIQLFHSIGTQDRNYGKGVHDIPAPLALYFAEQGLGVLLEKVEKPKVPKIEKPVITKHVQITDSDSTGGVGGKHRRPKNPPKGNKLKR